ncbi:MAG: hypothetical protein JXA20_01510 [Spirochaetes bacterium]|nr:hypothetical protein [Spirochaetota bacterium]
MELMNQLDKNEIREFFSKGWLTHDAMWFYHCLKELGVEQANRINRAASKTMAGIEIQRILKLMKIGKGEIRSFDQLQEIIDTTYKLIQPEFMKLYYDFPEKNVFRGGFNECFAYKGLKKFGMIDTYQCGVVSRVQGWFETLGIQYLMIPDFSGCLMHQNGKCEILFKFDLE